MLPLEPPSSAHPLGTDPLGRDALLVLLSGIPTSLEVAALASATSLLLLALSALLGACGRGRLAKALGELLVAVPRLPLLVFLALLGTLNPPEVALLIGALSSSFGFRTVAAEAERLAKTQFFLSSLASGAKCSTAWRLHVLRNEWRTLAGYAGLSASVAVYAEAGASMLGLENPSVPSVGKLAFLVFTAPGAVLTLAGALQVVASAVTTVLIAYFSYWIWKGPLSRLL